MRILLLLVALPLAWAQFPAVCNTQDSLSTKTCCPNNCGTTGTCVSIRKVVALLNFFKVSQEGLRMFDTNGLSRYLREFAPAMKDGEAMTAASVTLHSSPMTSAVSVWRGRPISSWFDGTLRISANRRGSTTSDWWTQLRIRRRRNGPLFLKHQKSPMVTMNYKMWPLSEYQREGEPVLWKWSEDRWIHSNHICP